MRMKQAVGFRNILVHEYLKVDDAIVLTQLAGLDDLRKFVSDVARFVSPR